MSGASARSATVTSRPSSRQTEAISDPMKPAPMIRTRRGLAASAACSRPASSDVRIVNTPSSAASALLNHGRDRTPVAISRRSYGTSSPLASRTVLALRAPGQSTLAGKLGRWLSAQGHTPVLVAADLQRPNAVTQLQVVGQRAGLPVFAPQPGNGVGDPIQVARDSIDFARRAQHDMVIVDTAGRLGIDTEMMNQAAAIRDAVQPQEILFVVDAMVGQDAVNTAEAFRDGVGFTGVALTKLDGDARGGAALSVRYVTGEPIMFASNGEKLEDFDVFHPDRMASRILGMGDMLTLIEQAERTFDQAERSRWPPSWAPAMSSLWKTFSSSCRRFVVWGPSLICSECCRAWGR